MSREIRARTRGDADGLYRPILVIVLMGAALGLAYNALGLAGQPSWGLTWIGQDPLERLATMPTVSAKPAAPSVADYVTHSDDPLGSISAPSRRPEFPRVGRPVQFDLSAVKAYYDEGAALIVDARDPAEFAEAHIPGAINVPYDSAASDPALLESVDSGGRPVIVYCGGGTCEISIKLADELFFAGHERVAVYMGGFPEWVEAGHPVESGGH
jgi:rhodanese-related sulfurtransferase